MKWIVSLLVDKVLAKIISALSRIWIEWRERQIVEREAKRASELQDEAKKETHDLNEKIKKTEDFLNRK